MRTYAKVEEGQVNMYIEGGGGQKLGVLLHTHIMDAPEFITNTA